MRGAFVLNLIFFPFRDFTWQAWQGVPLIFSFPQPATLHLVMSPKCFSLRACIGEIFTVPLRSICQGCNMSPDQNCFVSSKSMVMMRIRFARGQILPWVGVEVFSQRQAMRVGEKVSSSLLKASARMSCSRKDKKEIQERFLRTFMSS